MKIAFFLNIFYYVHVIANLDMIILHNADVQARFDEISEHTGMCTAKLKEKKTCVGGFPRIGTIVKEMRQLETESRFILYLFAGGIFTGTIWFKVHRAAICSKMMNALKPDAVALGYHEFDLGIEEFVKYVTGLESPVVAANLDVSGVPTLTGKIKPSHVVERHNTKIGIIGYISRDTTTTIPDTIKFLDEVASVRREVDALRSQGVTIIIALGNSGLTVDQRIATEIPEVRVVVGGKDQILLYNGPAPSVEKPMEAYPKVVTDEEGKRVPIVHAYAYAKYLGCLNLTFDTRGILLTQVGQPFLLFNSIKRDADVLTVLDGFRKEVDEKQLEKIGETRVILDGSDDVCDKKECNLGNLIADAYVEYDVVRNTGPYWTYTPIGLVHAKSIRSSIDATQSKGEINRNDLVEAHPLGSQIVKFSITGELILDTLEVAVKRDPSEREGEFLQFSGIQILYDMANEAGRRVISAKARCGQCDIPEFKEIQKNVVYNIVASFDLINDDVLFPGIKEKRHGEIIYPEVDVDIVAEYIERHSPISTGERDGIMFVSDADHKSNGNRFCLAHIIFNIVVIFDIFMVVNYM